MVARVNHGACRQCGRGVIYQGAEYCSPACYGKAYGERLCVLCRTPIALLQESQVCGSCVPRQEIEPDMTNEVRDALISPCGTFRYVLTRIWGPPPWMLFLGLNPSKADAEQDDPTVCWWRKFAQREKCGGFLAANLSAFRATDPKDLEAAGYPVGPDNDAAIESAASQCEMIVACWGSSGGEWATARGRSLPLLQKHYVFCFGTNEDGNPRHPMARGKSLIRVEDAELKLWSSLLQGIVP